MSQFRCKLCILGGIEFDVKAHCLNTLSREEQFYGNDFGGQPNRTNDPEAYPAIPFKRVIGKPEEQFYGNDSGGQTEPQPMIQLILQFHLQTGHWKTY
ncbi:hypothetical protein CEXT_307431 [Caerostris extrusa]|uniref:Uncharacterized protein n=1 Tax=Caerostris extrusa TaxID=172846 RepID=A0AAV4XAM2_CAEEX|nr:hypothetical protein CEXT_307431 [Caerostris extrusa]